MSLTQQRIGSDGAHGTLVLIGTASTLPLAATALRHATMDVDRCVGAILSQGHAATADGTITGVPILGRLEDLESIVGAYGCREALVSLPAAMGDMIVRVRSRLRALGVRERFLPCIDDVLQQDPDPSWGEATTPDYAAIIGRVPRPVDHGAIARLLRDKRVLITGAGGSIGSEIARLCAAARPEQLILMDRSENALFEIDREIASHFRHITRTAVLHDIVSEADTLLRFESLRPDVVFHAAAHKHVPMLEDHPAAAVNNNFFGTRAVADAALAVGAERFVMVSTDKAVKPSSVMGATKFLAEEYVRTLADHGRTRFSIVRFGNVLGSACSVLPIWSRQVSEGGPITITDARMTRYFMTIPEAASLVVQAAAIAARPGSAPIYVLDMGNPIPIVELAERYLASRGLRAAWEGTVPPTGRSVQVRITGARPGEKLHEQLAHESSELEPSPVAGVLQWLGAAPETEHVADLVNKLQSVRYEHDAASVLETISEYVCTLTNIKLTIGRRVAVA